MTQKLQWIQEKILDQNHLKQRCAAWRASGMNIVFTNGCFDILHRGHLDYLARAASFGNKLVVGVNSDVSVRRLKGAQRPVIAQDDRLFALASLLWVDAVCLFEEDTPKEIIEALKPDVLAKGGDYTLDKIVGADSVLARGGRVEVIPFVVGYSTTGLIEKIHLL
ncbi:MAG: D-glycero-beta-D-manno-heptose 1-phosphate adenylyltransferase [Chitinophagaceae bacterium]